MLLRKCDVDTERRNKLKAEIFDRLNEISKREDNWDGRGSKKPKKGAIDNAKKVLSKFVDISTGESK